MTKNKEPQQLRRWSKDAGEILVLQFAPDDIRVQIRLFDGSGRGIGDPAIIPCGRDEKRAIDIGLTIGLLADMSADEDIAAVFDEGDANG